MDKCLAENLKDPDSIPSQGDFFSPLISYKEEMNQMVKDNNKKNNSSNFLVFGGWPQTKIFNLKSKNSLFAGLLEYG